MKRFTFTDFTFSDVEISDSGLHCIRGHNLK